MSLSKSTFAYGLIITCVLCLHSFGLVGQTNQSTDKKTTFDKTKWEETTKGIDYTETFKERKEKEPKEKKENKEWNYRGPSMGSGFIKPLLIVLIIGVLAFLIFILLKNTFNIFSEKVHESKLESIVQNLEDNIHNADFDMLLNQAISNGQFKLAVRIFYLHIIKMLSDKDLIKWKKNKTNGHYVREMFQHSTGKEFAFLTVVYEQAWFSQNQIGEGNYKLISDEFTHFMKEID